MYNSELWTLTKTLEDRINAFHRRLLRKLLNIHWQDFVTNIALYNMTGQTKWTTDIRQNRLRWTGHLLRLPRDTPARQALEEWRKPVRHPRGPHKTTWFKAINKDLKDLGLPDIHSEQTINLAQDRKMWRQKISLCSAPSLWQETSSATSSLGSPNS